MADNNEKNNVENTNTEKKIISKKTLAAIIVSVIVVAAVVICAVVFNGKNKGDVSGDASGDAETEITDTIEDASSDESASTDKTADSSAETQKGETTQASNDEGIIPSSEETDIIDDDVITPDLPEDVTIVEKTDKQGNWPADKIPSSVPECKYVSLDRCSIQDDGNQTVWFMSWVSTVSEYNNWVNAITKAGFKESPTLPGRYANGKEIIDIYTEEDENPANYWVSVEIYTSTPIDYKSAPLNGVFPAFDQGDSTLEFWVSREDSGKFITQYAGSQDWDALLNAYMNLLAQNGFTVENYSASKTVDGKVYSVYLKGEEITSDEMIVYMY